MKPLEDDREFISLVGEYYVLYRLAQLRVRTYKLQDRFDFDLMTTSNIKIEVKTAHKRIKFDQFEKADGSHTSRYGWQFANHTTNIRWKEGIRDLRFTERFRTCDFYVLVCAEETSEKVVSCYVIPIEEFTSSKIIWIPENGESIWKKYKENWLLIEEENSKRIGDVIDKSQKLASDKKLYPPNTFSTTEIAEMFGIPQSYVTVWCSQNLVNYIPFKKTLGKDLYRITEQGVKDISKLVNKEPKIDLEFKF